MFGQKVTATSMMFGKDTGGPSLFGKKEEKPAEKKESKPASDFLFGQASAMPPSSSGSGLFANKTQSSEKGLGFPSKGTEQPSLFTNKPKVETS